MDQIYPDDGLVWWLQQMVGLGSGTGLYFQLWSVNVTPSLADTLATYTPLPSWPGSAALLISPSLWTFGSVVAHLGSLQAPNIAFTNTSGSSQNVYGYYITDPGKTKLLATARFDGAPIAIANGASQLVTPIVGDFSGLAS